MSEWLKALKKSIYTESTRFNSGIFQNRNNRWTVTKTMSDDERILITDVLNSIKKYLAQLQQLATAAQTEIEKLRELLK